jgi:hypothetical protein
MADEALAEEAAEAEDEALLKQKSLGKITPHGLWNHMANEQQWQKKPWKRAPHKVNETIMADAETALAEEALEKSAPLGRRNHHGWRWNSLGRRSLEKERPTQRWWRAWLQNDDDVQIWTMRVCTYLKSRAVIDL